MGNFCVSRDEVTEDDVRLHEKYKKLQDEVCATLGDRERFSDECGQSYRAACAKRGVPLLSKPLMTEMTRHFLQRLACDDDPRMVGKIYLSLERQFPNDDEAIVEAAFKDFIQDVLLQIEMDIREKIRKLEAKHPGTLTDMTSVLYNEHEQLAIGETNLEQEVQRFQQQQRLRAEQKEGRLPPGSAPVVEDSMSLRAPGTRPPQQQPLRSSELNITVDASDGQRRPLGRPPYPDQQQRLLAASMQPPTTLPPQSQQNQPPLSAAQLEKLQNSFDTSRSMQEAALKRLHEQGPMTQAFPPPPSNQDPMLTNPSISYPSAQTHQDASRPPPTNVQPSFGGQVPPPTAAPQALQYASSPPELRQEDVESMKHQITSAIDGLKVQVYNQHLQLEPKRLSLNKHLAKIGIFDVTEGGLGYPTAFFDIPDLKCITQGISQSIMENPPPPEVALGFRFSHESLDTKDRSQDKFLCFVFDSPEKCRLAGEAFSQLCGVPVAPAI